MTEKQLIIGELKREGASTRKMLERLQDGHLTWKPHAKSSSTIFLAQHLSNLPLWIQIILDTDGLDLAKGMPRLELLTSADALRSFFEERLDTTIKALENVDDNEVEKNWKLTQGDTKMLDAPKKIAIRYFALNHMVHHRGQLSVYLRLQDIPVPGMYGPSADEKD